MKLGIIIGSTRQGRQTVKGAKWVASTAKKLVDVTVTVIDLADYDMPFFAEPVSPRYNPNRQVHPTVQKFLSVLVEQDAYVVVTPEYNHSIPGALKNAFDYVDFQLKRKPSAIVSHGTVGGARAAMHLKEILSEGLTVPIQNGVALAGMSEAIDDEGNLSEALQTKPYGPQFALDNLLGELKWYSDALATARTTDAKT